MRKFLVAVLFVMLAPLFVQAQNIQMNWDGQNHHREITNDANDNKSLAIVGAGSLDTGAIDGASMTVNGKKININTDAVAKEVYDSVDRTEENAKFGIPVSGKETIGSYVAGGAAYRNNVTNSSVSMTGTTLQGRDVMGGASFLLDGSARLGDFSANNNSVTISGGSLSFYDYTAPGATAPESYGGNVYGG